MHLLNNGRHAFVFPPRCGTRWIAEKFYDLKFIDTKAPNHDFVGDKGDFKIHMFVRNPFTRERSMYRWYCETKQIDPKNLNFIDFIKSNLFYKEPSFFERYQTKIDLVDNFIPIENAIDILNNLLNIDLPKYDYSYHNKFDDLDDIEVYKNNPELIDIVIEKYINDKNLVDFNLTMFGESYII